MNWIKVEDKFPEDIKSVLVYNKDCGGVIYEAHYSKTHHSWCRIYSYTEIFKKKPEVCSSLVTGITHWMPLPEKP